MPPAGRVVCGYTHSEGIGQDERKSGSICRPARLDKARSGAHSGGMARYSTFRSGAALGAVLLSACSASPRGEAGASAAFADQGRSDPPGAALPLSIGGRLDDEEGNAASTAANCAVALNVTANRVAQISGDRTAAEVALINQAENYFASQAGVVVPSLGDSRAVTTSIDRKDIAEQAQLAIACLRRFANRGAATIPKEVL